MKDDASNENVDWTYKVDTMFNPPMRWRRIDNERGSRTYLDYGRNGINLTGRAALRSLIII